VSSPIVIDSCPMQGWMRYADGGGLTEQGRAKREAVRLQAAEWFAQNIPAGEIARRLRVSTMVKARRMAQCRVVRTPG
jgi:hypothetical protein